MNDGKIIGTWGDREYARIGPRQALFSRPTRGKRRPWASEPWIERAAQTRNMSVKEYLGSKDAGNLVHATGQWVAS